MFLLCELQIKCVANFRKNYYLNEVAWILLKFWNEKYYYRNYNYQIIFKIRLKAFIGACYFECLYIICNKYIGKNMKK